MVLVAALLLLVIGAAGLFASTVNGERLRLQRLDADRHVLARARQALIDRALTDRQRPGSLGCPDTDNDGASELGFPCGIVLGRLPWKTLDLPDLRDSAAERLWYAVSPSYLESAAPHNSDTPGQLVLDGRAGIVALVIAPGPPRGAQTQRDVLPNDPAQYLEGANADGNLEFTALTGAGGNDTVLAITVQEIMTGVHKRVLNEARNLLRNFLAQYSAAGFDSYPWLAPFDDPTTSTFVAQPGVREGLLPVHVENQSYFSDYTVSWNFPGAGVTLSNAYTPPGGTLSEGALRSNTRALPVMLCNWSADNVFDCPGPVSVVQTSGLPGGVAARTFTFNLPTPISFPGAPVATPPDATRVGSRNLTMSGPMPVGVPNPVIEVRDTNAGGTAVGGGSISFGAPPNETVGTLSIGGLHLAPVVRGADLWYAANDWHRLVYMALAAGHAPQGGNVCTPGVNCLTLMNGAVLSNAPALLLVAGTDLGGARPSANLGDYLEGDNASAGDDSFEVHYPGPGFNDAVLVLPPLPAP